MIRLGGLVIPCALGRGGVRSLKREGDGATPRGRFRLEAVLWRGGLPPPGGLPRRAIRRNDGWCDAPGDRNYNRAVGLPCRASHEALWRADGLYDIVVVLGHNRRPRLRGKGSAVFFHLARPDFAPTAGCVAVSRRDMRILLGRCGQRAWMDIN